MKSIIQSIRSILILTLLLGIIYPAVVTVIGQAAFPDTANGSLVRGSNGTVIGSSLLAQKSEDPKNFWPRASAADHATVASGASNKGPTSTDLVKAIAERRNKFGASAPVDLLTASGSGLDPHISPASARLQAARVAAARNLSLESVTGLVEKLTEPPQFGLLGEPRVNVFALNRALSALR